MNTTHQIVIVDQRQSRTGGELVKLVRAVALFAVLFVPGILADSAAMQWAGFVILLTFCLMALASYASPKMTIPEARQKLRDLEREGGDV